MEALRYGIIGGGFISTFQLRPVARCAASKWRA